MREIKFRAWNKLTNEMEQVGEIGFFTDGELRDIGCKWLKDFQGTVRFLADNYVLMQYTGLTDKHNTPIYEGDIVKQFTGEIYELSFTVKWNEKECGFWLYQDIENFNLSKYRDKLEVIGNIYENPELLEEK